MDIFVYVTGLPFQVIGECHSNRVDVDIAEKYKGMDGSRDMDLFLEFCLHTMLYQPPSQGFVASLLLNCIMIEYILVRGYARSSES